MTTTPTQRQGSAFLVPLVLIGVLIVGGGAYWLGRSTSVTSPAPVAARTPSRDATSNGMVKFEDETLRLANLEIGTARATALVSILDAPV